MRALWIAPISLGALVWMASARAGDVPDPAPSPSPSPAAAAAKGLDALVSFGDDNTGGVSLKNILDLLDRNNVGFALPSGWLRRDEMREERLAGGENEDVRRLAAAAGRQVTLKLTHVPLRVAVKAFADAYGAKVEFHEGDGYQFISLAAIDDAGAAGRGLAAVAAGNRALGAGGGAPRAGAFGGGGQGGRQRGGGNRAAPAGGQNPPQEVF